MQVNDKVRLRESIYEHADDHAPGGYLARRGEVLIVRTVYEPGSPFDYAVSHEHIADKSFAVYSTEVELIQEPT